MVHTRSYNLDPRAEIVAGTDPDPENLDLFCKRFSVPGYADFEEMLARLYVADADVAWVSGVPWSEYDQGDDGPSGRQFEPVEGMLPEDELYPGSKTYDADGWRIFPRNNASASTLIDALDNSTELMSSGDNGRRALEIGIALRESHRRGHFPVSCPLADRSLRIITSCSAAATAACGSSSRWSNSCPTSKSSTRASPPT